jgi:hypothetical protein
MCGLLKVTLLAVCAISIQSQNPIPSRLEVSQPKQKQSTATQQPPSYDQRGTEASPLVIKPLPTPKTQEETAQEAKERKEKSANDRNLVKFTFYLVFVTGMLAIIGFFQLIVFGLQARRLRQTVEAAAQQSEAMERAITQANRSAAAMEEVAKHIETSANAAIESVETVKDRTAKQMRAYLTVIVGSAIYQERRKNLRFEAKPHLVNTGHTPAHKVTYIARAAVLPVPLPDEFDFPLTGEFIGSAVVGPHQTNILSAVVDDFCPDAEIRDIKAGNGKALYAWGVIHYEDIFGEHQTTKFCQATVWLKNGQIFGYFIAKHNEAT